MSNQKDDVEILAAEQVAKASNNGIHRSFISVASNLNPFSATVANLSKQRAGSKFSRAGMSAKSHVSGMGFDGNNTFEHDLRVFRQNYDEQDGLELNIGRHVVHADTQETQVDEENRMKIDSDKLEPMKQQFEQENHEKNSSKH